MARSFGIRYANAQEQALDRAAETPEAVAWRLRNNAIRAQVAAEFRERYPNPSAEDYQPALDWMNDRIKELHAGDAL
jgi:hypothetical protein